MERPAGCAVVSGTVTVSTPVSYRAVMCSMSALAGSRTARCIIPYLNSLRPRTFSSSRRSAEVAQQAWHEGVHRVPGAAQADRPGVDGALVPSGRVHVDRDDVAVLALRGQQF